jgi:FKBP-type peptidyl-prolyl cis-trans isomerase
MYKGTLLDGTFFDSTADTTTADPFCHGIRMRGAGAAIPPNAPVYFDLTLVRFQ